VGRKLSNSIKKKTNEMFLYRRGMRKKRGMLTKKKEGGEIRSTKLNKLVKIKKPCKRGGKREAILKT